MIDGDLQDAVAIKLIMRDGRPTFAGQGTEKARRWAERASADFGSMKLYLQDNPMAWQPVLDRVHADLSTQNAKS